MYDITNEDTFNHLSYWLQSIDKVSAHFVRFQLCSTPQKSMHDNFDHRFEYETRNSISTCLLGHSVQTKLLSIKTE